MRHHLEALIDPKRVLVVHMAAGDVLRERLLAPFTASKALAVSHVRANVEGTFEFPGGKFDLAVLLVEEAVMLACVRHATENGVASAIAAPGDVPAEVSAACQALANKAGVCLLGPHAFGLQRPHLELNASLWPHLARAGGIAMLSQSSSLTSAIVDWAADTQAGFSLVASCGVDDPASLANFLDYCATDPHTSSVVVFMDDAGGTLAQARRFMSALRACASTKPVVVLKPVGAGPATDAPALAVEQDEAVFNTALSRAGAVRVWFFIQLFSAVKVLAAKHRPIGRRLAILSNSSAAMRLAQDWGRRVRVKSSNTDLPGASSTPDFAARWRKALQDALANPDNEGVLLLLAPSVHLAPELVKDLAEAAKPYAKPLIACVLGDASARPLRHIFEAQGIPALRTPEASVDAFGTLATFKYNQELLQQIPAPSARLQAADLDGARMLMLHALEQDSTSISGVKAQATLAAMGLPVARAELAVDATAAIVTAQQLGFPVAIKVTGEGITQKSRGGGVQLNLQNAREVQEAFAIVQTAARRAFKDARIAGVIVQEMVVDEHAPDAPLELLVQVRRHATLGPVIAFGAGGTAAALIADTAMELAPLNRFLAQRLIERTRISSVIAARPDADVLMTGLQEILLSVSEAVCELPMLGEMTINPLRVQAGQVRAVDATLTLLSVSGAKPYAHMVIHPFPHHLEREQTLRDGRRYTLRPIRPEDARALQSFVKQDLSDESRYMRFISSMKELSPQMLVRYTQIDYDRELAFVATLPDADNPQTERIIGISHWLLNRDNASAEYALVVGDGFQRQGVGGTLMRALEEAARDKQLQLIEGFVLASNNGMLDLMTRLSYKVEMYPDDPSLRRVWKALS